MVATATTAASRDCNHQESTHHNYWSEGHPLQRRFNPRLLLFFLFFSNAFKLQHTIQTACFSPPAKSWRRTETQLLLRGRYWVWLFFRCQDQRGSCDDLKVNTSGRDPTQCCSEPRTSHNLLPRIILTHPNHRGGGSTEQLICACGGDFCTSTLEKLHCSISTVSLAKW